MLVNIDELFQETIELLKSGSRPRHGFDQQQTDYLADAWRKALQSEDSNDQQLLKILCLVDHALKDSAKWESIIIETLLANTSNEVLIMTLGLSHRQVINRKMRLSERLSMEFISCFEELLEHSDHEVLEWCLRTIEQMGAQSVLLRPKVLTRKPGLMRIFNKHLQHGHEIIGMLEKRWKPFSN